MSSPRYVVKEQVGVGTRRRELLARTLEFAGKSVFCWASRVKSEKVERCLKRKMLPLYRGQGVACAQRALGS